MESEISLLSLKEPATDPFPEPRESFHSLRPNSFKIHSDIIFAISAQAFKVISFFRIIWLD
jgi:hypothetical protein